MSDARYDLDLADLEEVGRRVVKPVAAALFEPGELERASLSFQAPPDAAAWGGAGWTTRITWVTFVGLGQTVDFPLGEAGFTPHLALWRAVRLAETLEDHFGRTLPDTFTVPPPAGPAGLPRVDVWWNEPGSVPVWVDGRPHGHAALGLSAELIADLVAWQDDRDPPPPPAGVTATGGFVSYDSATHREGAAAAEAERRTWVGRLEAGRDALVARLRTELGPGYHVPMPPRIP